MVPSKKCLKRLRLSMSAKVDMMNSFREILHGRENLFALRKLKNLAANKFSRLPTKGLQNLRQLKTFNNRELKEFPPVETFPKIYMLALSYAYHCCEFIASSHKTHTLGPKKSSTLQETIVWLSKDDVDMSSWNTNLTDLLPETTGNLSKKFEEFATKLWKTFGRDYTIPDNLAQYAEEYFEDYKALENMKFSLQCLPEPGKFGYNKKGNTTGDNHNYNYEGGLKNFRPQREDGSTCQYKLVNFVFHLLTVTHHSFSHFGRTVVV
ncbi:leucine-rich repeat-containing G-protein coupled receptor 5 [Trichonephila clavipes]|nr:leucine-rich repeat-containing G-protein coupled receptor 5 [Trichonephila clavipes]